MDSDYPIEKFMASWADVICTVNLEDYKRAQSFNVKKVQYIHGIGINTERLTLGDEVTDIRKELNLNPDDFIVLSIGELNKNKNQKTIIKALALIGDPKIHYILCGKGDQLNNLKKLVSDTGMESNVHFLGYRKDVVDICSQVDLYVMPSYREGLPVASLEAMYCGLPLVTSNIRGLSDVMENSKSGFMCDPGDVKGFEEAISRLRQEPETRIRMGKRNQRTVIPFCLDSTKKEVLSLLLDF